MARKVYILTELMRSTHSGFWVEGTDIEMDYPDKYPLPMETEVLDKGRPIMIRVLPYCPYLEKEKQVKNGFPVNYAFTDQERDRLTFKFARLELDDQKDKIFVEYLEKTPWFEGNEDAKTRPTTKTIFRSFDEDALVNSEIADEELVVRAKNLVFGLDDSAVRNLFRLANPGLNRNDGLITLAKMKKNLLEVAEVNPEFILNGVKSNRDKVVVTVSRALEDKIISLDFPGQVALFNTKKNEWQELVSVSDGLSPENKFDRTVDYLQTEAGQTDLSVIESRILEGEIVD